MNSQPDTTETIMERLANAMEGLENTRAAYVVAEEAESRVRNTRTDALNALNRAQAAVDELYAQLRKAHPRSSGWQASVMTVTDGPRAGACAGDDSSGAGRGLTIDEDQRS